QEPFTAGLVLRLRGAFLGHRRQAEGGGEHRAQGYHSDPFAKTELFSVSLKPFQQCYADLCEQAGLERGQGAREILERYIEHCRQSDYDESLDGLVTNPLRRIIRRNEAEIRQLKSRLSAQAAQK
ncbi:hypothetical protein, partial [Allochromatium palmeri]|uniref:hypothetical protein n=1 Tax=Allochromatium palmeri TaxID=231048 RepID=UPI001CA3E5F2